MYIHLITLKENSTYALCSSKELFLTIQPLFSDWTLIATWTSKKSIQRLLKYTQFYERFNKNLISGLFVWTDAQITKDLLTFMSFLKAEKINVDVYNLMVDVQEEELTPLLIDN